jgi:hypothetical protein
VGIIGTVAEKYAFEQIERDRLTHAGGCRFSSRIRSRWSRRAPGRVVTMFFAANTRRDRG